MCECMGEYVSEKARIARRNREKEGTYSSALSDFPCAAREGGNIEVDDDAVLSWAFSRVILKPAARPEFTEWSRLQTHLLPNEGS